MIVCSQDDEQNEEETQVVMRASLLTQKERLSVGTKVYFTKGVFLLRISVQDGIQVL